MVCHLQGAKPLPEQILSLKFTLNSTIIMEDKAFVAAIVKLAVTSAQVVLCWTIPQARQVIQH